MFKSAECSNSTETEYYEYYSEPGSLPAISSSLVHLDHTQYNPDTGTYTVQSRNRYIPSTIQTQVHNQYNPERYIHSTIQTQVHIQYNPDTSTYPVQSRHRYIPSTIQTQVHTQYNPDTGTNTVQSRHSYIPSTIQTQLRTLYNRETGHVHLNLVQNSSTLKSSAQVQ